MSFGERLETTIPTGEQARVVIKSFISRVSALSRAIPLALLLVASIMAAPPATGADRDRDHDGDSDRNDVWLRIAAFTNIPLAGADVAVYDKAGGLLFQKLGATNNRGVFPARVQRLPKRFRVTVIWNPSPQSDLDSIMLGKLSLSADVQNYDSAHGIVYVNPVTTIVSRLLVRAPSLTEENAEAMTRQFLVLPSNATLGAALSEGTYFRSPYFSQSAFLSEASQYGGMDTFIDTLVTDILAQPLKTHSFPSALQSAPGGAASFIATNLAAGALKYVGGQGAGWIIAQTGLITPDATAENIAALQQGLADITSSIESLSNDVAQLTQLVKATATQTQYYLITTTAQQYATQIQGHESDLSYWAQYCPPLAADATPPTTTDPYCSDTNKSIVTSELQTEYESKYYEEVESFVQDKARWGPAAYLTSTVSG